MMMSDWLSPNPPHITDTLSARKINEKAKSNRIPKEKN